MIFNQEDAQKNLEFCNYLQPIISSCSGFIRTDGFVHHFPGFLLMMSFDESYLSVISLPVIFDKYMTARINDFLGLKEDPQKSRYEDYIYFTGWNMKRDRMLNAFHYYITIEQQTQQVYHEPDCYNIPGFTEAVGSSTISTLNVSDLTSNYRIYAGKPITPLNKGDTASLDIFKPTLITGQNDYRIIRYNVFKKKFKLNVFIYANILVL